jgi:uncharacterized membrane protein (UPF0136 family)
MNKAVEISLLVYAILVSAGGVMGFLKGKSKASLIAGLVSGALMLTSYSISLRNTSMGFMMGAGIAGLLLIVFGMRLAKTKKFMPSGMLLALTAIEEILLIAALVTRS